MRHREGLRDWFGLHKREKKEKEWKRKQKKALYGKVYSINRKGIGIIVFRARGAVGKEPFLYGNGNCKENFALVLECFL